MATEPYTPEALQRMLDEALERASTDQGNAFGLIVVAHVYREAGRADEASAIARRAAELAPDDPRVLRGASGVLQAIADYKACIPYCERAIALVPANPELRLHYAMILLSLREPRAAIRHLEVQLAIEPESALGWRNLGSAFELLGEFDRALKASDKAIGFAPDNVEFRTHRAGLLNHLGRTADALAELQNAENRAGESASVAWLYSIVFDTAGDSDSAIRYAERAHALAPENPDFAQYLARLRERRASSEATSERLRELADEQGQEATVLQLPPPRRIVASNRRREYVAPSWRDGLTIQGRVMLALLVRETRTRFGETKLGYAWAILEPISHLTLIAIVFAASTQGTPPIGQSLIVYYFTGVVPYLTFSNTIMGVQACIRENVSLLQVPIVHHTDVLVARGVLELLTQLAVGAIVLTAFVAIGLPGVPDDPASCVVAVFMLWCVAFGIGICNSVTVHFIKSWDHIFNNVVRALYFTSGVFLSPLVMPDWVREILAWNPLLQSIDWVRQGFFEGYAPYWLDKQYVVVWAICTVLLGFSMERVLRRRLSTP